MTGQHAPPYAATDGPLGGSDPSPLHADVIELCQQLIRFDTSNYGDERTTPERPAAEYVAGILSEAGSQPQLFEPRPGRTSVVARLSGTDPTRDALLVHGHLDVVPVDRTAWSVDPFGGEIRHGAVWGRGAVDMKNMVAMILAAVREMRRTGRSPRRDIVLAFLADEEAGGEWGSRFLVREHAHLFEACTEAISEGGGFSTATGGDRRTYLVETGRKGVAWVRLTSTGVASHGSLPIGSSAVTEVVDALHRIHAHRWPLRMTATTRRMLEALDGVAVDLANRESPFGDSLPGVAGILAGSLRHVANVTTVRAGDVVNVVPDFGGATIDGRFVPGFQEEFLEEIRRLAGPRVRIDLLDLTAAHEEDPDAPLVAAMGGSLRRFDLAAEVAPYLAAMSTDNAQFASLGIAGYGFVPLRLPDGYRLTEMFHGIDEHIPVETLHFGADVLLDFLLTA
jgi:acetylornithine deacetylase/succinyl-diaminopimelate desuccinylase-like protein